MPPLDDQTPSSSDAPSAPLQPPSQPGPADISPGAPAAAPPDTPDDADMELIIQNAAFELNDFLGGLSLRQMLRLAYGPGLILVFIGFAIADHISFNANNIVALGIVCLAFLTDTARQIQQLHQGRLMEQFALDNHFAFTKSGAVDETYGSLFRLGGNPHVSDIVTGSYRGHALRMFLYSLTVQQGRSTATYQDTVVELDLKGKLPHLLLVNKKAHFGGRNITLDNTGLNVGQAFGPSRTVSLEGDFNQHFTLLAPPDQQVPALEVFTPDFMELMEQQYEAYTIELVGSRVYIYSSKLAKTPADLAKLFALAKPLLTKLEPLATRLSSDPSIATVAPNQITTQAQSLVPSSFNWKVVGVLVLIGIALPILFAIAILVTAHR